MFRYSIVLLCAVLVISNVEFIQAGKWGGGGGSRSGSGGRHSYPSSGGLSGGGSRHSYPSSGGLSGNSRGGGYPAGGGGGSHAYPSGGSSGGSHAYPNSGANKYPSPGNSGSHSYPNSGSGLSGSNNHAYGNRGGSSGGTTNIHHHYHYNPPQQISYASPHGGPAMNYPVYRGTPPSYVYHYKDSGSKYSSLLTGLALFNLGALAGGAVGYGIGHSSSNSHNNNNYQSYKPQPGEVCIFGIKKDNGDFEETRIDCQLISSFILADQAKQQQSQNSLNQTTVTTTQTNTTVVNTNNTQDAPSYVLSPNGTLVTPGAAPEAANATNPATGGTVTSSVTVTTTNTTVVNAVDVKGSPIQVTPGMQCYVMRKTSVSRMKHEVPCGLLQTYADKSIKPNSAARNVPAFTILAVICAVFVAH